MRSEWTKADLLALKTHARPRVRAEYGGVRRDGRIDRNGRNAYVEVCEGGRWVGMTCSWGLVEQVLNDPYAPPIEITPDREYIVPQLQDLS